MIYKTYSVLIEGVRIVIVYSMLPDISNSRTEGEMIASNHIFTSKNSNKKIYTRIGYEPSMSYGVLHGDFDVIDVKNNYKRYEKRERKD